MVKVSRLSGIKSSPTGSALTGGELWADDARARAGEPQAISLVTEPEAILGGLGRFIAVDRVNLGRRPNDLRVPRILRV